jgi:hypothetical protein
VKAFSRVLLQISYSLTGRLLFDGKAKKEGARSEMKGRTRWRMLGWSEKTRGIAYSFWVGSAGALQLISLASSPPNLFG